MNRLALKKLNEGLQAEFAMLATDERNKSKSGEIRSVIEKNEASTLIDWIETNKDIYNNF